MESRGFFCIETILQNAMTHLKNTDELLFKTMQKFNLLDSFAFLEYLRFEILFIVRFNLSQQILLYNLY